MSHSHYLQPMMGAIAILILGAMGAPGAIAQVTNQSDVTGASPDVIYPFPVDYSGIPTGADTIQAAGGLADEIGDTYEACLALYQTDEPEAHLAGYNPCDHLEELIDQADGVLDSANQQWEENFEQARVRRVW
ncbi:hypothetical protein [Leptolyngbya sp. PL-A3]